jgi:hypothetical protein
MIEMFDGEMSDDSVPFSFLFSIYSISLIRGVAWSVT